MALALACPNCKQRISLEGLRYADDMTCPRCSRTYKVPKIPQRNPESPSEVPPLLKVPPKSPLAESRRRRARPRRTSSLQNASPLVLSGLSAGIVLLAGLILWFGFLRPDPRDDVDRALRANDAGNQAAAQPAEEIAGIEPAMSEDRDAQTRTRKADGNQARTEVEPTPHKSADRPEPGPPQPDPVPMSVPVGLPPPDSDLPRGSPIPKLRAADVRRFVGRYRVTGDVDQGHRWLFGAHTAAVDDIREVEITHDLVGPSHRLVITFRQRAQPTHWGDQIIVTDARMPPVEALYSEDGRLLNGWRSLLSKVGYDEADLTAHDLFVIARTARLLRGRVSSTQAFLSKAEYMKRTPLRDRHQLATLITTLDLDDDTLTIRRWAFGEFLPLVRFLVGSQFETHMASRFLTPQQREQFIDTVIEGRTLTLRRL